MRCASFTAPASAVCCVKFFYCSQCIFNILKGSQNGFTIIYNQFRLACPGFFQHRRSAVHPEKWEQPVPHRYLFNATSALSISGRRCSSPEGCSGEMSGIASSLILPALTVIDSGECPSGIASAFFAEICCYSVVSSAVCCLIVCAVSSSIGALSICAWA